MTTGGEPGVPPGRGLVCALAAAAALNVAVAVLLAKQVYADRALGAAGAAVPDFAAFWAAARMALEGRAATAWDWEAHKAIEVAGLGFDFPGWMPWHYPPIFQGVVVPLGTMPIFPAMALWIALTLGLYLWVAWRILPGAPSLLICLATGPTLMGLVNGQAVFLTGALTGLALLRHDERPVASGAWLGAMAIKPQLALAFPLVLAASRRWRMFWSAAACAVALVALSAAVFGVEAWQAFLGSVTRTGDTFIGEGVGTKWTMFGNVYGLLRHAGWETASGMAVQGAVALAALALAVQAWRRSGLDPAVRSAIVCYATVIATPRVLTYDLTIVVVGVLFQLRAARATGLLPGEGVCIALALAMLTVSVFVPPGPAAFAAPLLLGMCWNGRVRRVRTPA